MSAEIYAIADLHFGHKNMAIKRGFASVEEHDQHIIEKWNSVVKKHDTVWILGDIAMEKKQYYSLLDSMKGFKKVVLGNHDLPQHVPELLKHVNSVCGMFTKFNGIILSHAPIHPDELRGNVNVHGHVHEKSIYRDIHFSNGDVEYQLDKRYVNVYCDAINFTPVNLKELI
jgi:calcineurin-like phosphoesterase family protein